MIVQTVLRRVSGCYIREGPAWEECICEKSVYIFLGLSPGCTAPERIILDLSVEPFDGAVRLSSTSSRVPRRVSRQFHNMAPAIPRLASISHSDELVLTLPFSCKIEELGGTVYARLRRYS